MESKGNSASAPLRFEFVSLQPEKWWFIDQMNVLLLRELTSNADKVTPQRLVRILQGYQAHILLAFFENESGSVLVGTGSLFEEKKLTGSIGRIEDVCVRRGSRRQGVARMIIEQLLVKARALGLSKVELESRPDREGAKELYGSFGFTERGTRLFGLSLS